MCPPMVKQAYHFRNNNSQLNSHAHKQIKKASWRPPFPLEPYLTHIYICILHRPKLEEKMLQVCQYITYKYLNVNTNLIPDSSFFLPFLYIFT